MELRNFRQTYLGRENGRDRFALDCFIGAVQMREAGKDWEDIDPTVKLWAPGKWGATNTPYRLEIDAEGGRRIYPDKTDLSRYIHLPTIELFKRLRKRIEGNRIIASAPKFDVNFILANTGVRFEVLIKEPLLIDRIVLDVDSVGFDLLRLLKATSGLGVPRPRLIEADEGQDDVLERPLDWSFHQGQLELGFDLTGMRFPVLLRNTTLDLQVGASSDDGWETKSTGAMNITESWARMRANTDPAWQRWAGWRFTGSFFSQGDTIDVCYASVWPANDATDDPAGDFHFELGAAPATFTTTAGDITGRSRTTAYTTWDTLNVGSGAYVDTPSLVSPCQEIADSYSPTAMVLIGKPHTDISQRLAVATYDGAPTQATKLHIEYTAGAGGQTVTPGAATIASGLPSVTAVPGAVVLAPGPAFIAAGLPSATAVPGQATMAPSAVGIASGIPGATIVPGAVAVTPAAAALAAVLPSAARIPGAVSVSPSAMALTSQLPGVTRAAEVTLTPGLVLITTTPPAPTIVPGSVVVTPGGVTLVLAVVAPSAFIGVPIIGTITLSGELALVVSLDGESLVAIPLSALRLLSVDLQGEVP